MEDNNNAEPLDENYFKIHLMIYNKAPPLLRKTFADLWQNYSIIIGLKTAQSEWKNTKAFGSKFIQGPGSSQFKNSQKIQKRQLESGNIEAWDLSLLIESIKSLNHSMNMEHPHGDFEKLKEIRNDLAHRGNTEFGDEDFKRIWQTATQILEKLGMTSDEIDQIDKMKFGTTVVILETEETKKAKIKVSVLKEKGNKLFKEGEFWKAIKIYSEAVGVENVGSTELGTLYSNRSAAYAEVKYFTEAKDDAKCCINLRPNWGKGYYRLGYTYEKLEKFKKALRNYKISLEFDKNNEKCLDARNSCVHILAKQKRLEHLDPLKMPIAQYDLQDCLRKLRINTLPQALENMLQKKLLKLGYPVTICNEAHKYLHGTFPGYPQNYEQAAVLFSKAASRGNAEGMYNLGVLTAEGKGVPRDMNRSLQLKLEAAKMTPLVEIIPNSGIQLINVGVMEAQHAVGLLYENGEVVEKDYKQAYKWYTKALQNGCGFSANNLGLMFSKGKGFPVDIQRAVGYYKVGALLGTVRAMEGLAFHYYQFGSQAKALQWYTLAMKNNTMNTNLREIFQNQKPIEGFSVDEFENELDEELQNNKDMKEFVTVKDYDYHPAGLQRRRKIRRETLGLGDSK